MVRSLLLIAATVLPLSCQSGPQPEPPDPAVQTPTTRPAEPATEPVTENGDTPSGQEVYGQVCVTCHGKTGDGKGLELELFSFGAPEEEWKHGPTIEGIVRTLSIGVHETSMHPFPQYGEAEKRAVAGYVLELREQLQAEDEPSQ